VCRILKVILYQCLDIILLDDEDVTSILY
jgi:hypothetical protein